MGRASGRPPLGRQTPAGNPPKTIWLFPKTHGVLSKTRCFFSQTRGVLARTIGFAPKTRGVLKRNSGALAKTRGVSARHTVFLFWTGHAAAENGARVRRRAGGSGDSKRNVKRLCGICGGCGGALNYTPNAPSTSRLSATSWSSPYSGHAQVRSCATWASVNRSAAVEARALSSVS